MKSFLDCWFQVASQLFPQALAGGPELVESPSASAAGETFGLAAIVSCGERGRFSIAVERRVLEAPLLGEGVEQQASWEELLRETVQAAAGEFAAQTGSKYRVEGFEDNAGAMAGGRAFEIKGGERGWILMVRDEVSGPAAPAGEERREEVADSGLRPGVELLLDVELEASLRFGSREMLLGDILDLGPGDVVQLDRHVSDPVDLIVGDKIVARGEVVLVNGNFGLRVTEVAAPRKRLETIRCLF